jgi:hypothetical protein
MPTIHGRTGVDTQKSIALSYNPLIAFYGSGLQY